MRRELPSVRVLLAAGERCSRELVSRWGRGRTFVNAYGPTETTVCATMGAADPDEARAPSIGPPLRGTAVRILNRALRAVPSGAVGELFVGGVGVARGYIGKPGLTAEWFLPDDGAPTPGARMYRTGDLVRIRTARDGEPELECIGRNDHQVKVRGHRIELGEIESVLSSHGRVGSCVVVALDAEDGPFASGLVAYVTPRPSEEMPSEGEVREHLAERLPAYMVPSAFVCLASLPRTTSGKIDRSALPAPAHAVGPSDGSFVAPQTPLEEALCAIMGALVGRAGVGVHEDFFSIGGHSLLAVSLVSAIETRLGRRLPLAALYANRTVEQLARLLAPAPSETLGHHGESGCLVSLRRSGHRPPLFLVHPVGGTVLCYDALTRRLTEEQPVYALQAAAFVGETSPSSVEEMATRYLIEIRRAQPAGPYRLGGWSMGGMVAWEMSRQLAAAGESVERLVLLDTHADVARADDAPALDAARLAFDLHLQRSPLGSGVAGGARELAWEAFRASFFAARRYEPAPLRLPHPALLVRAADNDDPMDTVAWLRLAGERLEIRDVAADHWGLLAGPRLVEVTCLLEDYLRAGADEAAR
jgi:thioesterase domain-containing protein